VSGSSRGAGNQQARRSGPKAATLSQEREGFRILPIGTKSARIIFAQALALVACLGFAAEAFAEHARPKAATPSTIRFVPAFEECFGPNSTHGAPLALPSCNAPIQSSSYLTMNTPDRPVPFNTTANGTASMILKTTCLTPGTTTETGQVPTCPDAGDQLDVKITFNSGDVRCVGAGGQGNCTSGAGSLYNGKLLVDMTMRLSDHYNATTGQGCAATTTCSATANFPVWPLGLQCASGNCNYVTSADLIVPGVALEGKRAVIELGAVEVQDAGLNGNLAAAPAPAAGVCPPACQQDDAASLYLSQGLFIP
jgi:hypothetical protein